MVHDWTPVAAGREAREQKSSGAAAEVGHRVPQQIGGEYVAQNSNQSTGKFPQLGLAGPAVEDDVRRLIGRYGAEAVKNAVRERTKPNRGAPPKDGDWRLLDEIFRQDALQWLDGGDPFAERTNYSIARRFAEQHPQSMSEFKSIRRRILRKLQDRRRYYTLVHAEIVSKDQYPFGDYLRVLGELVASGRLTVSWQTRLHLAEGSLADYTAKYGPPDAALTMQEIEADAVKPFPAKPASEIKNILQLLADPRSR